MARGSKKSYTSKQRQDTAKKRGTSSARTKQIAYATVSKKDGGAKKTGSGRMRSMEPSHKAGRMRSTASTRKAGRKGGRR